MKIAVVQFPGSNCDQDALYSLRDDLGIQADYVWHQESSLSGYDGVFIPGGFTYGDYLRCGAMAARSSVMAEVIRMAESGAPVMGACNGFQILCEAGVLSGALLQNAGERFLCRSVYLKAENRNTAWTQDVASPVAIPIAHNEGRFVADQEELARIEGEGLVAFRYCEQDGSITENSNVNGSLNNIAGLVNKRGNVLGLMPHPERMTKKILGSDEGLLIISGFKRVLAGV